MTTSIPAVIEITWLGGLCPVQGTGTIDGVPFYFRARGEHWSIEIGHGNTSQVVDGIAAEEGADVWSYDEGYKPTEQFSAGYMELDEARAFIGQAADRWREREVRA